MQDHPVTDQRRNDGTARRQSTADARSVVAVTEWLVGFPFSGFTNQPAAGSSIGPVAAVVIIVSE
jgi:hypothetical protein